MCPIPQKSKLRYTGKLRAKDKMSSESFHFRDNGSPDSLKQETALGEYLGIKGSLTSVIYTHLPTPICFQLLLK